MTTHKHLSMDDEAAELLDAYDGNQSELVSNLVKEYFTQGVYDTELAARERRRKVVKSKIDGYEAELSSLRDELGQLEELADDAVVSDVETVARELHITDPDRIHADNPAIQKRADRNGIDADVLADEVWRQYQDRQSSQLSSVDADD